jgi:hypothetical protein
LPEALGQHGDILAVSSGEQASEGTLASSASLSRTARPRSTAVAV